MVRRERKYNGRVQCSSCEVWFDCEPSDVIDGEQWVDYMECPFCAREIWLGD